MPDVARAGGSYCDGGINSTGMACRLEGFGQSLSGGSLQLHYDSLPGATFVLTVESAWHYGSSSVLGGTLCVSAGCLKRVSIDLSEADGTLELDLDPLTALATPVCGAPVPGDNIYLQGWFRDGGVSQGARLSNAIRLVVAP